MTISLKEHQKQALEQMKNGCILNGGTGSGKSRTALAYYYILNGGVIGEETEPYVPMKNPCDLYIITPAKKRDSLEWEFEFVPFSLGKNADYIQYDHNVVVDSWNNIKKYTEVENAFFIFDEQKVIGDGVWAKSFLKIAAKNRWIILSATPGDTWMDYIPVFIANGFYRNRTEFKNRHVVYKRYSKFPQVDKYLETGVLLRHRADILVDMDCKRNTVQHHEDIIVEYNKELYKYILKNRYDIFEDKPIENASEFCMALRKIANSHEDRIDKTKEIVERHKKAIIFYNFNYELDILRQCDFGDCIVAEWNGQKHEPIPDSDKWVYLVQYNGCEGWNCITTDTMIFFSQNYSYKTMVQASGRIDRLNTPYTDLYYYHLKSRAGIDTAIYKALKNKKEFNERAYFNNSRR